MPYTVEEIHESLVNGQRKQMVEQIKAYGNYDFWHDYREYLMDFPYHRQMHYFGDAVVSYHRIEER